MSFLYTYTAPTRKLFSSQQNVLLLNLSSSCLSIKDTEYYVKQMKVTKNLKFV